MGFLIPMPSSHRRLTSRSSKVRSLKRPSILCGTKRLHCTLPLCLFRLVTHVSLTTNPSGSIFIKLMDKDNWIKDDHLGDVVIPVAEFLTGDPIVKSFPVQNEPKQGKKKNSKPGQLHVTLHFPGAKVPNLYF